MRPLIAVLAAALTVAATPAPATAVAKAQWIPAPCATGELSAVHTDAALNTTVAGVVTVCGTYKAGSAFTAVLYRPDRIFAVASGLRPYAPDGPTPVTAALVAPPAVGTAALCLMRSAEVRMACARLDFTLGQPPVMRPIATDDPLVAKPVLYIEDATAPRPPDGFCGSCLQVP